MGGADWQRVTKKAKAAVTLLATELLRLYAQRKITPGHSFAPDTTWQKEFEEAFSFWKKRLTNLMLSKKSSMIWNGLLPMERLLCGDVGYGKTEVLLELSSKQLWMVSR